MKKQGKLTKVFSEQHTVIKLYSSFKRYTTAQLLSLTKDKDIDPGTSLSFLGVECPLRTSRRNRCQRSLSICYVSQRKTVNILIVGVIVLKFFNIHLSTYLQVLVIGQYSVLIQIAFGKHNVLSIQLEEPKL